MIKFVKAFVRRIFGIKSKKKANKPINDKGNGIFNFIDIGSVGQLPEPWLSNAGVIKHLLKFEPRDKETKVPNVTSVSAALWDKNETLPFYIYKGFNHTGSSLFKQNFKYVTEHFEELKKRGPSSLAESWFDRSELVREEKLECKSLEHVLDELNISEDFHFIKIDAQGAEYEILKGSEKILKEHCLGLHLELFNFPLYEGIKLLPDVEEYLKSFGFKLVKKFPAHGTFDSQHDCLFLKTESTDTKKLEIIKKIYKIN